jgi:PhoPQ-activated pathogenicity-related protein
MTRFTRDRTLSILLTLVVSAGALHAQERPTDSPDDGTESTRGGIDPRGEIAFPSVADDGLVSKLREAVAQRDPSYRWELVSQSQVGPCKTLQLQLVSQTWMETPWRHVVFLVMPADLPTPADQALLFIAGGNWRDEWGDGPAPPIEAPREVQLLSMAAAAMKTPVVVAFQIPFQPQFNGLREDALIAETFEQFIETGDERWPLLWPMARAASSAMDAASEASEQQGWGPLRSFTVSGASKRGWTSWFVAAADDRVKAVAPIVIDMLDMPRHLNHQMQTWGTLSPQILDYQSISNPAVMRSERGMRLIQMVDPFRYRIVIQQPKLIVLATNDPYWPVDSINLYWDKLEGSKHLLHVPNEGHGIRELGRVFSTLSEFHRRAAVGERLPEMGFERQRSSGRLQVKARIDEVPQYTRLWRATSQTRDFRESTWVAEQLDPDQEGGVALDQRVPDAGSEAFFVEWQLPCQEGLGSYFLATPVQVVSAPNVSPVELDQAIPESP